MGSWIEEKWVLLGIWLFGRGVVKLAVGSSKYEEIGSRNVSWY